MTTPCKDSVRLYLDTVFSYCDGIIPLRSFQEVGGKDQPPHNIWIENDSNALDKAMVFAQWANEHQSAFYVIPGTVSEQGQASAADVRQMQTILVDIDSGDIWAKYGHLIRYLDTPTLVMQSGGTTEEGQPKLHMYWKLSEAAEGDELKLLLKARHIIALKVGGDIHFQSAHQPIRVAGSIYHKYEQNKLVTICEHHPVEYHLADLLEAVDAMPVMDGIAAILPQYDPLDFNSTKTPLPNILTTPVHEGGKDEWTRFEGISRVIGHWLRCHHDGIMSHEEAWERIQGYNTTCIVPEWPEVRLKEETQRLWKKHLRKHGEAKPYRPSIPEPSLKSYTLKHLLGDLSPMPDDIIAPRILTPGGLLVFAGAPKVGKSDFLLTLLTHMAAGIPFLGFTPPRPLRIFYLQAEVQYDYLRERLQAMHLSPTIIEKAAENLVTTPQIKMILNEQGLEQVIAHIKDVFGDNPPDIITIDPIRNVFDGGKDNNENDNNAMLFFLQQRVEKLREAINPAAGMILAHHTRKLSKKQFEEDPFQALSGAGSMRGYYSAGIILYRPDESRSELELIFELRNGKSIDTKILDKRTGEWMEIDHTHQRIVNQNHGQKLDAERIRKREVIVQLIYDCALQGNVYTVTQFAEAFENKAGLGGKATIIDRIGVYATKGYIKFFKNSKDYGLASAFRSKYGFMCVQDMLLQTQGGLQDILPTEYKHPQTGALLPVENPHLWVYDEEELPW